MNRQASGDDHRGWTPPQMPGAPALPPSVPQQPGRAGVRNAYGQPIDAPAGPPQQPPFGSVTPHAAANPSAPTNAYGQPVNAYGQPVSAPSTAGGYGQPARLSPYGLGPVTPAKKRKPLLVGGVIAVGVAIALVAGWMLLGPGHGTDSATAGGAVKGYLEALARGDAAAALSYSDDQPGSKEFLSDDILKQQTAKWPITNIRILGDDSTNSKSDFAQVHVVADFGEKTSDVTLSVKKNGDGKWRLSHSSVKIASDYAGMSNAAAKTLTIFGKAASGGTAYVFPGYLEFGSSNQYLTVNAQPVLLDQLSLGGQTGAPLQATWALNDAATKAIMAQVANVVSACSASTAESPPSPCTAQAFGMVDGTVNWGPADLSRITVSNLDQYRGLTAMVSGQAIFHVTGIDRFRGGPHAPEEVSMYVHGTADLTTSPLTVSFR